MDDGKSIRDALEAAQAKVKALTAELEKARGTTPELAAVQRRLAHLERSSEERFTAYERRLDSHRERERELGDELDATRAALKTATQELERAQRKLERAEARLERLKPKKESVVTGVLSRPRIKRLEAELDAARKELARVQGLLGRSSRRR